MTKLLLVTDGWHPQINGLVTALDKMKDSLERDGFEVAVIHPGLFRSVPLPGYPEIRLALLLRRRIRRMLMLERPGLIHLATEGPLGWSTRALCRRHRWRFTSSYHRHCHLYAHLRVRLLMRPVQALLRIFHGAATCTMVATPSLRRELETQGFRNIMLWPLGVDTTFFVRDRSPEISTLANPVFLFFSRLAPEKNPKEFLNLDLPGTKLVIGDGPERKRLESCFGMQAMFIGYKRGEELVNWLSICDVMVFPLRTETFGLVVLEALACGIPVAAHDIMGPRDIIDNFVDGILDENLKKAAMGCLSLDRTKCREKALRYSWDASAAAFKGNLVRVVERQRASIR